MTLNSRLPLGASLFLDFRYVPPHSAVHGFSMSSGGSPGVYCVAEVVLHLVINRLFSVP